MEPIELSRWEPSPEDPRRKQYAGQRTAQEVFEELRHRLEGMGYLPDEYFLMNRDWENGREIPRGADIFCTTDYGGSEGIYWQTTSIQYVLHNEKYAGDSLAQKTYTTRTLPHRKKRNQGEYDQYFVPGSHPAIIDRELFDRAQALLKQKGAVIHPKSGVTYPWTGTVICGQCGSIFKRKKCRESAYWTCRLHDKSPDKCQITQIPESEFERAFLRLYYKLRHHGMPVLSQLLTDLQTAQNRKLLWSLDIVELNKQIADIVRQERLLAELKQQGLVDPDIYITRSNTLAEQLRTAKLEKERFLESEEDQTIRQTQVLLEILETGPEFLEAFDEELFSELVAKIIVENNECLRFRLINGLELTETIERTVR